jgi:hypothetical protein
MEMATVVLLGLLAGYIWGVAGMLGYPGVSWKPGALLTVACAVWRVAHDAAPSEPLIEAAAILIFIALNAARDRLSPTKEPEKRKVVPRRE